MVQVAREWKRVSILPGIALDPNGGGGLIDTAPVPFQRRKAAAVVIDKGARDQEEVVNGVGEQVARRPAPFHRGPATQDPGELLHSSLEENDTTEAGNDFNSTINTINPLHNGVDGEQVEELLPVIIKQKSQPRPSSWQRRKARRAADEAEMLMEFDPGSTADRYHNLPSSTTQPSSTVDASAVPSSNPQMPHLLENAGGLPQALGAQRLGAFPKNSDGVNSSKSTKLHDWGHSQWPRYMPKPSEMIINRSPIFYCSTFPLKPGFTARRTSYVYLFIFSFFLPTQNREISVYTTTVLHLCCSFCRYIKRPSFPL